MRSEHCLNMALYGVYTRLSTSVVQYLGL